jgi:hypothetical protein
MRIPVRVRRAGRIMRRSAPEVTQRVMAQSARFLLPPTGVRQLPKPPVAFYAIYRAKNAPMLAKIIYELREKDTIALHALDHVAPTLRDHTHAEGPGQRMALLASLVAQNPPSDQQWLCLCDDDVQFVRGSLRILLGQAAQFGLEVAQPAHTAASHYSHRVTLVRPGSLVRRTNFVEVGPVVVISPEAREKAFPGPTDVRMGWGLDVWWSTQNLQLGIVDAVRIRHLGPVARGYPDAAEREIARRYLAQLGAPSVSAYARTLSTHRRPLGSPAKTQHPSA